MSAKTKHPTQPALPIATPAPTSNPKPRAGSTSADTTGMPAWLRRQLTEAGVITQGHTRKARPDRCPKCKARVIAGWTDEPCSMLAIADPRPLSNLGEVVALLQGRTTFDLTYRTGRLELDIRDRDHIEGSPPESPDSWRSKGDVLAQHLCPSDENSSPLPTIESRIP